MRVKVWVQIWVQIEVHYPEREGEEDEYVNSHDQLIGEFNSVGEPQDFIGRVAP